MRGRVLAGIATIGIGWAGAALAGAGQQGIGQSPSSLPLTPTIREKGSSVTPAFEGWYYGKDGSQNLLVGYFNRNTKQELDIPVGPNNRIEPGGPDMGQPTHFATGRQWGVFTIKLPKDFGTKKLTWTIVANGLTNAITLHTQADYVVEPFEDAANKNTPPGLKFKADGKTFAGAPNTIAETFTATVGTPLALTVWAMMIGLGIKEKGLGGWLHELFCAPFGSNPIMWPLNFLFNVVEYVSKPLSHSLRLFGNMYAGEIIFLLLWLLAAVGFVGSFFAIVLGLGWAIFHILIVVLQAYIFMMLTIVYVSMAHEHH